MNNILNAVRTEKSGECLCKNFVLLVPDRASKISFGAELSFGCGQAAVIPPLTRYFADFSGIEITFENALLPFKKPVTVCDGDGALLFAAKQALKYIESGITKKNMIISALGNMLASYIAALSDESKYSPAVEFLISEIEKGVSDCTFCVGDSIKKLPFNYDYARKLFKKETGATPAGYLLKKRMTLARQLISSGITNKFSEYTVSQLSEACGYAEPLYFSRVFKGYFGVPPTEYR